MKKTGVLLLTVFLISGCATAKWERSQAEKMYRKQSYDYTLCSPAVAKLLIQARPPAEQWMIESYRINIVGVEEYLVSKHSDSMIHLCPGNYAIEISAMKGSLAKKTFGKPSVLRLEVKEGDEIAYEYYGPYWMWSRGQLRKL